MKITKLIRWFGAAINYISAPEITTMACNIAIYIFCDKFIGGFYLWAVIMVCDTIMLCAHGAYLEVKPNTQKGPWYTPTPILLRISTTATIAIQLADGHFDGALNTYAWYVLTMTAVCHTFFCVLLTLHARDDSWLAGTNGRVGTPNWLSIGRMALSVLIPHLLIARPFGATSGIVAICIMATAIITDATDGYLARKRGEITKAGKALDPLGDKIIFYPMAITYLIANTASVGAKKAFLACFIVTFVRDAIFVAWFFFYYAKIPTGIGASMIDKVRMASMCVWLGIATLSLTVAPTHGRLARASFATMAIIAILSVVSFVFDIYRIYPPKPKQE